MRASRGRAIFALATTTAASVFARFAYAQTPTTIKIGTVAADSYAEPYYADEAGFFQRAGLSVEVTTFPGSGAVATAAAGGAIDVGLTDVSVIANAIQHGVPLVTVAGAGLYRSEEPTTVLCTLKESPFRSAKDLEGQTITVATLVSLSSIAVRASLAQSGADLAKVRLVEMAPSQVVSALQRGTVAAGLIAEPLLSQIPPDIHVFSSPFDAIAKRLALNDWFTTRDWLTHNSATAKRLVFAVYETARWANTHHDETLTIITKHTKLEPTRAHGMRRATYATSLDVRVIQPVLDAAAEYGSLQHKINAAEILAQL